MLVKERLEREAWVPPWLHHQHVARYEWARELCRGRRTLDAACGYGYGSWMLSEGARVVSLDIALDAVIEAKAGSASIPALLGDTTRLPFADASFGTYVSFETIEHVQDDVAYVREARRVLQPGGIFICSTPNRLLVNPGNTIHDAPFNRFHVREYTREELRRVLAGSFNDIIFLGQSSYPRTYAKLLAGVGRLTRMGAVRLHQLRKVAGIPFERRARHLPREFDGREEPEVLIAICR